MEEGSWADLLPQNPIFTRLGEPGALPDGEAGVTCQIRGELFVWSHQEQALLTTSLKKTKTTPELYKNFQVLRSLVALEPRVVRLVPDSTGEYIALCSRKNLHVAKLVKQRGKYGEYFGWLKEPTFKPKPIAREFFYIHQHNLKLLQTSWHQTTLLLLTSDNTLRLFSLFDPETPLLMIPLQSAPFSTITQPSSPPSYTLVEQTTTVGFDVWRNSAFVLQESGDVVLASLDNGEVSSPLKMTPPSDDNYESESEATSLLLLSTSPCVLVIANSKGKLYNCVYLQEEESCEFLYVAETIHLRRQASDSPLTLIPDHSGSYQYFVLHGNGVHQVTVPWITTINHFLSSDRADKFVADLNFVKLDSSVKYLIATDESTRWVRWVGMTVVSEFFLGGTSVIGLFSDGVCHVVNAGKSRQDTSFTWNESDLAVCSSPSAVQYTPFNDFEKEIDDILHANRTSNPVIRNFSRHNCSQQELYQYLTDSASWLKRDYLQRQKIAKEAIIKKRKVLDQIVGTQLTAITQLAGEQFNLEEIAGKLKERVQQLTQQRQNTVRRLEALACRVASFSTELSQAQLNMREELKQLERRVDRLVIPVQQAKLKSQELLDEPTREAIPQSLSEKQSTALLASLTYGRDNIKRLIAEIKTLSSALPGSLAETEPDY